MADTQADMTSFRKPTLLDDPRRPTLGEIRRSRPGIEGLRADMQVFPESSPGARKPVWFATAHFCAHEAESDCLSVPQPFDSGVNGMPRGKEKRTVSAFVVYYYFVSTKL